MVQVKICGLNTADAVAAAVGAGADLVGFVFFEKSPRYVSPSTAAALGVAVPKDVLKVGLVVDASDADLDAVAMWGPVDMVQLHGSETPERVVEVKTRFKVPVMKALPIASAADVQAARAFEGVVDRLLFDAKPPADATRPGGNALAFDWGLLAGTAWSCPWLLAGGLTPENVTRAIRISGAPGVDVSSGVEDAPGVKNVDTIRDFIRAAKGG
ncbi:MAG: phosphoribosylanthranilate isomerase [Rhodospirillaceae bacterium]